MNSTVKTAASILILTSLTGLAGCAGTTEMDTMRNEIKAANEKADKALAEAAAARKEAAAAAQAAAEAKAAAEAARDASERTDAKIDRMFKKSMYK